MSYRLFCFFITEFDMDQTSTEYFGNLLLNLQEKAPASPHTESSCPQDINSCNPSTQEDVVMSTEKSVKQKKVP